MGEYDLSQTRRSCKNIKLLRTSSFFTIPSICLIGNWDVRRKVYILLDLCMFTLRVDFLAWLLWVFASINHLHFSICSQLSWRSHSRLHAKNPRLVCRRIKIDFIEFSRTYFTLILMSATFWRMSNFPVSALTSTWDEGSIFDQRLHHHQPPKGNIEIPK